MRLNILLRPFFICLALLWLLPVKLFATEEPYSNSIKGTLKKGDTLWVKDEKFRNELYDWNRIQKQDVTNFISLRFSNDSAKVPPASFYVELTLKLEYYTSPEQPQPLEKRGIKLRINYNQDTVQLRKMLDYYRFGEAHWVRIEIEEIQSDAFGEIASFVELQAQVMVDRKYRPDSNRQSTPTMQLTKGVDQNGGGAQQRSGSQLFSRQAHAGGISESGTVLEVSIPMEEVGEEFDIEWTPLERTPSNSGWVDQLLNNNNAGKPNLEKHFWNNASRQTLRSTRTARITLAYRQQYLVVRTRAVNYDLDGIRIEGEWDYNVLEDEVSRLAIFELYESDPLVDNSFESQINWQYIGSFADDGRKKEVITYFDGALRNRQVLTQTYDGEEPTTIVGESLMDPIGRNVLSFLPVPIPSTNLRFKKNTYGNDLRFNSGLLHTEGSFTRPKFNALSVNTNNPASTYYSPQNNWITEGNNGYIPNAGGYPYSVTGYSTDPTGLVRYQGGLGSTFQPINSHTNNRTTRYYYAKPTQTELNMMFGSEIGYAEHYQKVASVDENGQISLVWKNLSGKTIATALTGAVPANIGTVPPDYALLGKALLIKPSDFTSDRSKRTLKGTATHFVASSGNAAVELDFSKLVHQYTSGSLDICTGCVYDVTVKVVDEYGAPVKDLVSNLEKESFQLITENASCSVTGSIIKTLNYPFPGIGEYTFQVELNISSETLDNQTDYYINERTTANDLFSKAHFLQTAIDELNLEDCYADCSTCIVDLGTKADFVDNMLLTIQQNYESGELSSTDITDLTTQLNNRYDALLLACEAKQENCVNNACEAFSSLMLIDVSPGGQFALYNAQDENFSLLEPHLNVLALYFRTVFPIRASSHADYQATAFELPDGTLTSPHDAAFTTKELILYWQEDWGYKFLPYHPEFCKLEFCQNNNKFYVWDEQISEEIQSLDQIAPHRHTEGLSFTNTVPNWLLTNDPFFATGNPGAGKYTAMANLLANFSSLVAGVPAIPTKSINEYIDYLLYCNTPGATTATGTPGWANCQVVTSCRVPNEEWRMYVEFYLMAKAKIYEQLQQEVGCVGACEVGKPVSISMDGCPNPQQVEVRANPGGSCSSGLQSVAIVLPFPSSGTTTVALKYPAAYASGLPATITISNGLTTGTICIPVAMPVTAVVVDAVSCAFPTLPANNCPFGTGGTLSLTSNAVRETSHLFSVLNTSNGEKTSYFILPGRADQTPSTTGLCDGTLGTPTFYACYAVKIGANQVAYYNDVWVVSCVEDLCASAPTLNMELQLGTNRYAAGGYVYYVQPNGASIPEPDCATPLLLYSQTCVKVKVGTNAATTAYNANVYRCDACDLSTASISVTAQTSSSPLTFTASNGTYYLYPNVTSGQTITPPTCSGSVVSNWTNCLTVILGGNSTRYDNVRYFFCPTPTCPNSTDLYVTSQVNSTNFSSEEPYGPCTAIRTSYKIFTGYTSSNQPTDDECDGLAVPDYQWYNCLQLENSSTQAVYRFTNVWVKICSELVSTCSRMSGGEEESELRKSSENLRGSAASETSPNSLMSFMREGDRYRIVKNYYDGTINLIRKATSGQSENQADSIPGYSKFTYKSSYYVPRDSVRGEQFNNVEVATLITAPSMMMATLMEEICSNTFEGGSFSVTGVPCGASGYTNYGYTVSLTSPAPTNIDFTIRLRFQPPEPQGVENRFLIGEVLMGQSGASLDACTNGLVLPDGWTLLSSCITISVPSGSCPPEYAHKTSRFPTVELLSGSVNAEEVMAKQMVVLQQNIGAACEGNADALLGRLRPFLLDNLTLGSGTLESHAVYIRLRNRLIDVCKAGGDINHPNGASTTRPGTNANGFTSFQQVLTDEFPLTIDYNPWLIGGPLPWGTQQQVTATTITRTNESICEKLATAESAATLAGKTLRQYLIDTYGSGAVTVTVEELEQLQEGCTNCRFLLDEPITLPVFLDTKNDGCISRSAFNDAKSAFTTLFTLDLDNPNYSESYRNFMNSRFGLVMSFNDYMSFDAGTDGYLCNQVFPDPIPGDPYACAREQMGVAIITAKRNYEEYIELVRREFRENYITVCMGVSSKLSLEKAEEYKFMTLYLYDNAGNLIKTVTPRDYRKVETVSFPFIDDVRNGAPIVGDTRLYFAPHINTTRYYYNSLNQVISQYTPDADVSNFWYDTKGRLILSQNKEQHTPTVIEGQVLPTDRYSYTQYDALGRIIEVGEVNGNSMTTVMNNSYVQDADLTSFMAGATRKSITRTFYDTESSVSSHAAYSVLSGKLHHLRKRVVASSYQDDALSAIQQATYYSYDLMGNVNSLWQQVEGLPELKQTDYQFELSSGKTTAVLYQDGKSDAFYHQYEYDAENRIKSVYTNTQKTLSAGLLSIINAPGTKKDAGYQYYLHGPLSRTELGGNLQGMDYTYTIQGWLKALNGQDLNPLREMGRDGETGTGLHSGFGRDVLTYSLGYFIGDYSPINGSTFIRSFTYNAISGLRGAPLYNGTISHTTLANKGLGDGPTIVGNLYSYHQMYTLASKNFQVIPAGTTSWHDNTGSTVKYRESYGKDLNGNLIRLIRNGDKNIDNYKMDDLNLTNVGNKLSRFEDLYKNVDAYPNDLEHQDVVNYFYDGNGNLIKDLQEGIDGIFWNVYGKIREIKKGDLTIKYRYDAAGNRVYKEEIAPGVNNATWYVRDAQGNVLSTYEGVLTQTIKESYIYGSSRLGSYNWDIVGGNPSRTYEISNYLGNVMATIGDGLIPRMNGSLIEYYDADIQTATDYYSYGMPMPGRTFSQGNYRYGFNGKENDNEVKGTGNQQDYGMRIYDPRLGRFLSVDPLTKDYPWYTPYQFAGNMPIVAIDLDGAEPYISPKTYGEMKDPMLSVKGAAEISMDFLAGGGNTLLGVFGAVTQVPAAAHYGNKIPKNQWAQQFPMLPHNNIAKDLVVPAVMAPVDVVNRIRDNPFDARSWGEAAAILVLARGGSFAGKFKSKDFGLKVDLMGGQHSRYGKGYINYDRSAKSGIKGEVVDFQNHFGEKTISEMIVDNPQAPFLENVSAAMQPGGTITIRGGMSNRNFNSIFDGKASGLNAFEVVGKKENVVNPGYKQSDGATPVGGQINEIILRRKQ